MASLEWHFRCTSSKRMSFGLCTGTAFTGMLTSPKEIDPDHIARIANPPRLASHLPSVVRDGMRGARVNNGQHGALNPFRGKPRRLPDGAELWAIPLGNSYDTEFSLD